METILVVEDEPTFKVVLCTILRNAGYNVIEANDGAEALEALNKQPSLFSLIVSDRNMPNIDGLALFKQLQHEERFKHIPFIMQTGADSPTEVEDGIKAGVYYYLIKPYEEDTIVSLVKAALHDTKQHNLFVSRIQKNQQALGTFAKGEFYISQPYEAQNVAFLLGGLFPNAEASVTGIYELALNAIEHGNLEIGFDLKAKLIDDSTYNSELQRRLELPENQNKKVKIELAQNDYRIEVLITDQGRGFNWKPFLEIEPARATKSNGRGIAKANILAFDELQFYGNGNQVHVTTLKQKTL